MTDLTSLEVCLRPEHPEDADAIRHVNVLAFDRRQEADLVDALRAAETVALSAVVLVDATTPGTAGSTPCTRGSLWTGEVYGGKVVGHALFTSVNVKVGRGETQLLSLASVAVLPAHQHQGVGTLMVSGCLEYLRTRGHRGVVVVGDPKFYRRFGFIEGERWGLSTELDIPSERFLALSLTPGVLGGISGTVQYQPEFATVLSAC